MKLIISPLTKKNQLIAAILLVALSLSGCGGSGSTDSATGTSNTPIVTVVTPVALSPLAQLGRELYFDINLSDPPVQSCSNCHLPTAGFADPSSLPVSRGAVVGRFGSRNAPTASYASFIPEFRTVGVIGAGGHYEGGQFLDGRASTLEIQAQAPFLNELEMNMADKAAVITQVQAASYASQFTAQFGAGAFADVDMAYTQVAEAIAEFERSDVFKPFSSVFDAVLAGSDVFSMAETRGQAIFNGKGNCSRCHDVGPDRVFTDFRYHNIGVPANPLNPFLNLPLALNPDGTGFVDLGLGREIAGGAQDGKFRTPTLRNVALTPPYMHNGVFDTLQEVVEFYNRSLPGGDPPEVAQNVDADIGNLGLTPGEIQDLVAFMQTLSDR